VLTKKIKKCPYCTRKIEVNVHRVDKHPLVIFLESYDSHETGPASEGSEIRDSWPHASINQRKSPSRFESWLAQTTKGKVIMSEFKNYIKKTLQPMRPYIPGEDLTGISVWNGDVPKEGGMIAQNPKDPKDTWYVAKKFFEENYIPG